MCGTASAWRSGEGRNVPPAQRLDPHDPLRRLAVLWTIIGILLLLWILGFAFQVGGGLIHALLVIALVVFIYNLVVGRRSV